MTDYPPPSRDPQQPPTYPAAPPPPPPPPGQPGWGDASYAGAPATYGPPTPYAEWIKRVGAYLVDLAVTLPAYVVALIGLAIGGADNGAVSAVGLVIGGVGYLGVFAVIIWNLIVRQGRTGWSLGKQALGIRLIGERTGQPIGPGLAFVRMLAHILDALPCYLGYLWPLWDAKKQTFADKIMSTVVIEQRKA